MNVYPRVCFFSFLPAHCTMLNWLVAQRQSATDVHLIEAQVLLPGYRAGHEPAALIQNQEVCTKHKVYVQMPGHFFMAVPGHYSPQPAWLHSDYSLCRSPCQRAFAPGVQSELRPQSSRSLLRPPILALHSQIHNNSLTKGSFLAILIINAVNMLYNHKINPSRT